LDFVAIVSLHRLKNHGFSGKVSLYRLKLQVLRRLNRFIAEKMAVFK
jgi:hypothetical protein